MSIPRPAVTRRKTGRPPHSHALFSPYFGTQVNGPVGTCTAPNATNVSVAQSTSDPDMVVMGAQMNADYSGCGDVHPWVFVSHDGGLHWQQQIIPGNVHSAGGYPTVTFDPVRNYFVYAWVDFDRDASGQQQNGQIRTMRSVDNGDTWGYTNVLDSEGPGVAVERPASTVDINPGSPHYGRVVVTWTHEDAGGSLHYADYSDDGGQGWANAGVSVNTTNSRCGTGTSPAFDAAGELMVAWWDCSSGFSLREEISPTGGQTFPNGDVTITGINDIGTPFAFRQCSLNNSATASNFRCNSFPSLAGDPNGGDVGNQGFAIVWASNEGGISQIKGLSTANGGTNWDNPWFGSSNNNGDKFMPKLSIAQTGNVQVSYSSREGTATTDNPKGTTFNQHFTWASSLGRLRGAAGDFATDTLDFAYSNPGSMGYIGDYSGQAFMDNAYDALPGYTRIQGGQMQAAIASLCYQPCPTNMSPNSTYGFFHNAGDTFHDAFRINIDPDYGGTSSGRWNVVAVRNGDDGTTVDNDMSLYTTRYETGFLANSTFSPPRNDYVLINDAPGHATRRAYHMNVHSFSSAGGAYSAEWHTGSAALGVKANSSMTSSDVARVYDTVDTTGKTIFYGARPSGSNNMSLSLAVHAASLGDIQGAPAAKASQPGQGAGQPAFIGYKTGSTPTQTDALVVQNNNGGSGAYSIYKDTAAPTGTITVNNGDANTTSTSATLTLNVSNPTAGDPVWDMRVAPDGSHYGNWRGYATSVPITLPAGDGVKTVRVVVRNGAGATTTFSDTIVLDTAAPTITRASQSTIFVGADVSDSSLPVRVDWAGSDTGSGICSYKLQESVNGGTFTDIALPSATATSITRSQAYGSSYQYQVRAADCVGHTSAYGVGDKRTPAAVQESNPSVAFSSGWTLVAQAGAMNGNVKTATAAGATAAGSFSGAYQVGWVSTQDTASGGAHVQLDRATASTVDLNSSSTHPARVVYAKNGLAGAAHTLTVSVDGTSGHPKVTFDALVFLR